VTHPLLETLDDDQTAMILVIGRPIATDQPLDQFGWPRWDFIRRKFERNRPGADPEQVLASLPATQRFGTLDGPYGLWWRTAPSNATLAPGERLGLTIPGLHQLTGLLPPNIRELPKPVEALLRIIRDAAEAEEELDSDDWWSATQKSLDLRQLMGSRPDPPVEIIGTVLQHEFVSLAVATTQFNYGLPIGEGRFSAFQRVTGVEDYLSRIDVPARSRTVSLPNSPLALPAVLDYLGRVLSDQPAWGSQRRFVRLPDFQSASQVTQLPVDAADFEQRLSALWTIIGHLDVPKAHPSRYAERGWGTSDGSVNSLTIWLADNAGEFGSSDQCAAAIKTIRNVGTLRQGAQHSTSTTRARAQQAQAELGLPKVIIDYPNAWDTVLNKVASAFYAICAGVTQGSLD